MIENYLQVLEQSMHKKTDILSRIQEINLNQEQILKNEGSVEDFGATIDEKEKLIEELSKLDEGFETLYRHIEEQLVGGREQYKSQIAKLQQLIVEVTEKSVAIQAQETRNYKLAQNYFTVGRKTLQKNRTTSKAALDYYKSMSNSQIVQPQFMDKKK
ncbi:hypothetical protein EDD76_12329 [Kineothrix alysoides]|uniref:FlgN protein n=1 Tax=Kineothrix alysoides TaxID=1469948 RepID=A0A4R1QK44_9FIRM|nr:hypothetical protein [Kineothrix alysoides]TCL54018.1 hypothetical protein EDD76_12329 [Kineothrix alysoides]